MYTERKRIDNSGRNETMLWMILGPILIVFIVLFGFGLFLLAPVACVYAVGSGLLFVRMRNPGYFVKTLFFLFLTLFSILVFFMGYSILTIFMGGMSVLFLIGLVVLILIRDYKWRTDQVLELAAMPVDALSNGYTMRPMPAGELDYRWEELKKFAGFLRRNLISVPFFEKDRVVFSLNRSRFKLISFSKDYIADSWVSFDRSGKVSVHISRNDYALYKDSYAFDQLCNSLGNNYIEFFKLFRQKKESEIINRLDSIRM